MNGKFKIIALTLTTAIVLCLSACPDDSYAAESSHTVYAPYRDVPGITERETEAIESLRESRDRFIYGAYTSTECFYLEDGNVGGYTARLCDWLSELFGIPFEPVIYDWDKWNELMDGLASYDVDFNGDLTRSPERLKSHYMTEFIAERTIKMWRMTDGRILSEIAKNRPLRYVFYENTVTYDQVAPYLGDDSGVVFASDYEEIYRMLKNGEVDAYFDENVYESVFEKYGNVSAEAFLPLVYGTASMATRNPELAPVISVVQKALENGAIPYLADLYAQGYRDYCRHKLFLQLTDEEKTYINVCVESGAAIPVILEIDNYPISFYNAREEEWQGIAPDILAEIESLTGLRFVRANDENASWVDLMHMLENGEAALISELIKTPEREGRFLWPDIPYMTDNCALLTRLDFKDVGVNEILRLKIGLVKDSVYSDMFQRWFPRHPDVTEYSDNQQALGGLERGEVDAVMNSQKMLLQAANYMEKPGFKLNILFSQGLESFFGLDIDEAILCSIISKALNLADINIITARWIYRMFDYRSSMLRAQRPFLIVISILLIGIVLLLFIMYFRSRKTNKYLSAAVRERTRELEDQTKAAISASRAKSDFLAKMSHEIRTPMNVITGMSEVILRNEISPAVFEYAVDIKQASDNLLGIINDILDFSKIESGKMETISAEYLFTSLINDVITTVRMRLMEKPVNFLTNIDSALPGKLIGDEARIRQILLNLLSNAVKYTNEGHIAFTVSGVARELGEIELTFEITDTGIGIKEADMDKLFDEFAQFDTLKNRGVEGTGLGLTIARSLCRSMGGDITVSSKYGEGSTFKATIPQKISDASPSALVKDPDAKNVLVYERRGIYAHSIVLSVKNLGVRCSLALNRNEFLRALDNERYSHILAASPLFDEALGILDSIEDKPELIFMKGYGDVVQNNSSITMPAHSISIASALNDTHETIGYSYRSNGAGRRFTAPSARILIADDIITNLKVAVELLSPYKLQTDTCDSGTDAVRLSSEKHYDIIFMDHMMPEMDGVAAMETIRALPGDHFKEIPIIALTANAVSGMREMFLEKGFSDYLSKPIEIRKLDEILERWVPAEKRVVFSDIEKSSGESPTPDSGFLPQTRGLKEALNASDVVGIDFEKAMNRFEGSEEAFLSVLRSYVKHTPTALEKLRTPTKGTLREYAIVIHGVKGSSYGICADAVGRLAEELEEAAKGGRLEFALAKNDELFAMTGKLIDGLASVLKSMEKEKSGVRAAPDKLTLEAIMDASGACDATALEKAVSELERFSYENRADLVTWMRDQLDNLEYEAIRERLEMELTDWDHTRP
jgi:signal transduction histidine kinase/CheY-like chemotaxis protein